MDDFTWKIDADAATHSWDVILQGGLGTGGLDQLLSKDGGSLTSTGIDPTGMAHLYDLQLAAGTYVIGVVGDGHAGPQPYILQTRSAMWPGATPSRTTIPPERRPGTTARHRS